eukprot:1582491-Rhodomonas_salina.2
MLCSPSTPSMYMTAYGTHARSMSMYGSFSPCRHARTRESERAGATDRRKRKQVSEQALARIG